jgi:tetratricopeptide (TPR) repeat protein
MRAAATRALELDPDLLEGLSALAACEAFHEWRWRDAEAHFQRAIALSPSYSIAHFWYGLQLEIEGRHEESLAARRRGLELDPLWLRALANHGWGLFMAGRVEEATAYLRDAVQLDPDYFFTRRELAIVDLCQGRYDEAIRGFEMIADRERGSLAHALGLAGCFDRARAALERLGQESRERYISPVQRALAHLGLGDTDKAVAELQRGVGIRAVDVAAVNVDPRFRVLSSDRRFKSVMRLMNLQ